MRANSALDSAGQPAPFENTASYLRACGELVESLCLQAHVSDDALRALLDHQPSTERQKQLVVGLNAAGLIDDDQTAAAFLWFPLEAV